MMNLIMRLWKDEEGQGMVEYGLIIALVSVVVIGVLFALGDDGLKPIFEDIKNSLINRDGN